MSQIDKERLGYLQDIVTGATGTNVFPGDIVTYNDTIVKLYLNEGHDVRHYIGLVISRDNEYANVLWSMNKQEVVQGFQRYWYPDIIVSKISTSKK